MSINGMNNHHEQTSVDTVSETKELEQIAYYDPIYLERKKEYEQQIAAGNLNAKPPEPSPEHLRQRAFLLGTVERETAQTSRSSSLPVGTPDKEEVYTLKVNDLVEIDMPIVTDSQSATPVQSAPSQLPQTIDTRNALPVQSVPQFNLRNMLQQSSGIIGAVQADPMSNFAQYGDNMRLV